MASKYEDISLDVADNGFILRYCELRKNPNAKKGDVYSNMTRDYKKEVFEFDNGQKAVERMIELAGKASKQAGQSLKEATVEG